MDIEISKLAAETAALLAPYLPYLLKGGKLAAQKAFEKTGEIFAEKGWDQAEKLWGKLKPKVDAKPAAQEVIEEFVKDPSEVDALPALRQQLKRILAEDSTLAQEISITMGDVDLSSMQVGDGSIGIKGNVGGNVISGDRNIIADQVQIFLEQNNSQTSFEKEKIEKAYRSYLEKLRRHCNALPLAVLGEEESSEEDLTLDKIYTDLDTTQFKEILEEASDEENKPGVRGVGLRLDKATPISVMEAATTTDRLVLLGDAGAGKSTFVKELLALQAAVLLGESKESLTSFAPDLIPVLIVLRDLVPKLAGLELGSFSVDNQKQMLSDTIIEKIHVDIASYKASEFISILNEALEQGKILLVLDGLDEVPQDLRGLVRQAVGALIQIHKIERIIITSRSRSYTGQAVFPNFQAYTLAPFDEEKINNFSRAWYNERQRQGHIQPDQVEVFSNNLSSAATDPDLIEMSSNPMMLTSIALLHQRQIGLPRERVRLYKLIVDVLISRWQKYKTGEENFAPSEALTKFLKDDNRLRAALEILAYEAHRAENRKGNHEEAKIESDLSRGHALALLEQTDYLGSPALASEFLDYVDQRAGLLVGKGGDIERPTSYSFPHRTIQEYLAGCYLIGKREPWREYYEHAAEGDFWSLATLMGAEELLYNRRGTFTLLDLIYHLCPAEPPQNEQDERSLLWSGQIACIIDKENIESDTGNRGSAYLQRLIPRTVNLLESHLTPRERAEAGDTLAKLGDPRPGVIPPLPRGEGLGVRDAFLFCEIPAGKFLMGNTAETDSMSSKNERPQFTYDIKDNYFMSRYPITNAQFDLFVNDPNGYTNEHWYSEAGKKQRQKEKREKPPKQGGVFDLPNHPVVNITWYEAVAFTHWLTNKLRSENLNLKIWKPDHIAEAALDLSKYEVRLPTEAEWEKAARHSPLPEGEGLGVRVYPWGDEITPNHANYSDTNIGSTSAVGAFPLGMNEYGLLDMSGNVYEWCGTKWVDTYEDYPSKEDSQPEGDAMRVLRGGSYIFSGGLVRCADRFGFGPNNWDLNFGFRVVVCVASSISP